MKLVASTLLVVATAVLAVGCGGGGSGASGGGGTTKSVADFVRQVTTQFSRGQSGRLWDTLLPADQRVVTRARFVACQANEGWNLKSMKVLETYADTVNVGTTSLQSRAVTVRVTSDDGVTTATVHAVPVGSKWHWILQPSDRTAYMKGKCPRTG